MLFIPLVIIYGICVDEIGKAKSLTIIYCISDFISSYNSSFT